jgi:hypothetical protein
MPIQSPAKPADVRCVKDRWRFRKRNDAALVLTTNEH